MASRSATDETPRRDVSERDFPETVLVASVVRPHGVRGELKVLVESDVPNRFDRGSELLLALPGKPFRPVRVAGFRPVKGGAILALDEVATREEAEALRGARLEVPRSRVPEAPEGFYYYWQLVGCRCFTAEDGELGEVVDLLEDGGGHLLRVRRGDRELLVPFVAAFLRAVDVDGGRIDLDLPPGLLETCESKS